MQSDATGDDKIKGSDDNPIRHLRIAFVLTTLFFIKRDEKEIGQSTIRIHTGANALLHQAHSIGVRIPVFIDPVVVGNDSTVRRRRWLRRLRW